MKNSTLQIFTNERLAADRQLTKSEIADFLHGFQMLAAGIEGKRKLISIRVPERLLELFKQKAMLENQAYQTQIVELMRHWILK